MNQWQGAHVRGARPPAPIIFAGAIGLGIFAFVGQSGADVAQVSGSAYGASINLNVLGVGVVALPPTPSVTLPATGGNESTSLLTVGIAPFLTTGIANVSTQGTTGPNGGSTSSASLAAVNALAGNLTAEAVSSTCTANEGGMSGSTTLVNAMLRLADAPAPAVDVSGNPGPNTTLSGTVGGQSFSVILNEQIVTADSITVNAVHISLAGPLATGDIILSQSHCDIVRAAGTTTTLGGTTSTTGATTSTTGATTTTQATTTTTQATTTTTQATTTTTQATTTTTQATTTTTMATTTTTKKPKAKCNAGRGNGWEIDPATGRDCDPGNSWGRNNGGD